MSKISIEELKERVHYDPESGAIIHLKDYSPAGTITSEGYTRVELDGKKYQASHIAHALMTGAWPSLTIDHKDRDPTNNRWDNLREATQSQQNQNQGISSRNKSGIKGVYKSGNKWVAQITLDGKNIYLGSYDDLIEAKRARLMAELENYEFSPLLS